MTDELREATERLNLCRNLQIPWEHSCYERTDGRSPMIKWQGDLWTYYKETSALATHREDDDEPVTEEWVSQNFPASDVGSGAWQVTHNILLYDPSRPDKWHFSFYEEYCDANDFTLVTVETRGHVRRLCEALGVQLNDPKGGDAS